MSDAETILRAGNLIDFGPAGSRPEPLGTHLVIADGRIVAVGGAELERAYPDAEVIDFGGDAAILPGRLCDMARRGDKGPMGQMMRFSFGPLNADSYESDLAILKKCM